MPLDPYSPCPGGTGKKLKFCCADLATELDKAHRMLEGDQSAACLEYIKKLETTHPHRACLLAMKLDLQIALDQGTDAQQTIAEFLQHHPGNPIALANDAVMRATQHDLDGAVDRLQAAIEAGGQQMMPTVYESLGVIGQALLMENRLPAGRAHLLLQAGLGADQDSRAMSVLMRLNSSSALPLLFKELHTLSPCPTGVSWKKAFEAALTASQQAHWRSGERQFAALVPNAASSPAIWRNLALLRSWLGDHPGSATAWRKYASLDVPLDDAVEAEATAQLLESDPVGAPFDTLTITYPVTDFDELERRLSSDRRVSRMQVDLASLADEGEPAPRGAFWLLDRELPRTGVGITRADIPLVLAQFYTFGRETDRDARLEIVVPRDEKLDGTKQQLQAVAGELLGAPAGEEVSGQTPALQHLLSWNWRLPDDTPPEHRRQLLDEQRHETLREIWPTAPMRILDGQTPLAAAKNPAYKIRLLASILNLELSATEADRDTLYNDMRTKLGLPAATPIEPASFEIQSARLARLHRLNLTGITKENLLNAYSMAATSGVMYAGRKFATAIIAQSADYDSDVLDSVYRFLWTATDDPQEALRYIETGRAAARAAQRSIAQWDMDELRLRVEIGDFDQMGRLINKIAREHQKDQRVMRQFSDLLMRLGLLGPDGSLRVPAEAAATAAVPSAPAAALWTPESAQPAGEKGKLWLPGME